MPIAIFLTNCDSSEDAERIADHLLVNELAAAVQIHGPARSRYRWRGAVHHKLEWTLVIKSSEACEAALTAAIRRLHRYELPGILKLHVDGGEAAYLRWIDDSVKDPRR